MKYYIGEYWAMMNSNDPKIREEGETKWNKTVKEYGPYFETIKGKLPKTFIKLFNKNSWFHDFVFNSINLTNTGKYVSTVEFQISHDDAYKITFTGVKGIMINIPTTRNWLCGILTWGYTEFELNNDSSWVIRILCDFDCEIEILFKKISIKSYKHRCCGLSL
jgi:hypothetical protein